MIVDIEVFVGPGMLSGASVPSKLLSDFFAAAQRAVTPARSATHTSYLLRKSDESSATLNCPIAAADAKGSLDGGMLRELEVEVEVEVEKDSSKSLNGMVRSA